MFWCSVSECHRKNAKVPVYNLIKSLKSQVLLLKLPVTNIGLEINPMWDVQAENPLKPSLLPPRMIFPKYLLCKHWAVQCSVSVKESPHKVREIISPFFSQSRWKELLARSPPLPHHSDNWGYSCKYYRNTYSHFYYYYHYYNYYHNNNLNIL